ncbi:MAG: DNA-processing protein DprA [Parvibaculaceae bacterium]
MGELNEVESKNAPERLEIAGDVDLVRYGRRVSVVGSRKVSDEGQRRAKALVEQLVEGGIIVVSGLASGLDTVAHTTAMACGGRTVAVLGTPLDKFYPAANKDLQQTIMTEHAAVSQFPSGYPATPKNFPMRNRTMALLTDATIIVEASEKSGTRHQGWEALRLGRAVYLLENILADESLTWPKEMISYGAEVLTRENLCMLIEELPAYTDREAIAL